MNDKNVIEIEESLDADFKGKWFLTTSAYGHNVNEFFVTITISATIAGEHISASGTGTAQLSEMYKASQIAKVNAIKAAYVSFHETLKTRGLK